MREPRVSIIIPTFNRSGLITRSIESVLNQSFRDFELIIVDDGSTDNTEAVVKSLPDERIRYIKRETNSGGSAARNVGIRQARASLIAFQDSDDVWMPDKLSKQLIALDDPASSPGVVYSGFLHIRGEKTMYLPGSKVVQKDGWIHGQLLLGNFISTQTALVRRESLDQAGYFDESLPRLQDWDLFLRLSKVCEFKCIDEPLVKAYYSSGSISSNSRSLLEGLVIIHGKYEEDFTNNLKAESKLQFVLAHTNLVEGRLRDCRAALKKAVSTERKLNYRLALLSSYAGLKICRMTFRALSGGADKVRALTVKFRN
jgi:glycosyltransferase involved in cell wall biosynthesis